jgi:protein arginine kinase
MNNIFTKALSRWMEGDGPHADTVISSRVRLARNLAGRAFPHRSSPEQASEVIGEVARAIESINKEGGNLEVFRLGELGSLERQVLVEKHLISPQHAQNPLGAVVICPDEEVSIMVNEEDHLRIQCLLPGLQLEEAWAMATRLDDSLENTLTYAFGERRGYITACPTNVGTALRASVMTHLPALVLTNRIGGVIPAISQLGLVVRGLYGEGTEAAGNIFQVSNQVTLGKSEEEIISNLHDISEQIIEQEKAARTSLMESRVALEDRVWRSYGILANARSITSEEAIRLWSNVRLGADLGLLQIDRSNLNELIVLSRPAFVSRLAGRELAPAERDEIRAANIRERLGGQ